MITVYVNGETRSLLSSLTMAELLQQMELQDKRIAVELNREIIPRTQHGATLLQQGDRIEIVHAIGGG